MPAPCVLVAVSYPSPLKATFSFSGQLPNIFTLTKIPAVTWEDHWVPSESTGLQSVPTTSIGKEPDKQRERAIHQCQAALQYPFLLYSKLGLRKPLVGPVS